MQRTWADRESGWRDWRWQLRNRVTADGLADVFPGLRGHELAAAEQYAADFHFALTPYVAELIECDSGGRPLESDPIWRQHRFLRYDPLLEAADYDRDTPNWELPHELPTHLLHHKYPDKAAVRITDSCG